MENGLMNKGHSEMKNIYHESASRALKTRKMRKRKKGVEVSVI
jgi:hypothetical protein